MFDEAQRRLQERFDTTRIADRIVEKFVTEVIGPEDREFIERQDMFLLATVDPEGRPNCSYKGGDPGFVRVVDEKTIAFPNYDGNGMYLSMGNITSTGHVGLLFIDLVRGHRLRLNGEASVDFADPLRDVYPEAQFVVRVRAHQVFPNCPRYIHRYEKAERSRFVPRVGQTTPVPDWKKDDWAQDALPKGDPAQELQQTPNGRMPMAKDLAEIHRIAVEGLVANVEKIADDHWDLPTPNTEWNVRALVEHLVGGTVWVAPLVAGETIAEIGDRYNGDLVGDDPKGAFRTAAAEAVSAVLEPGAMERTVDLSAGPTLAADYILERIADAGMHTWDLARALGTDETIHPEVVAAGRELLAKVGDLWRSYGALGPITPTEPGADEQTLFIAESGRTP